jgi:hypothetical protein
MLHNLCFFHNFIFSSSNMAFFISCVVKFKYQPYCVGDKFECSKCWFCSPQLKSSILVFVLFVVVSGKEYIRKILVGIFINIASYHMKINSTMYDDLSVTTRTSEDSSVFPCWKMCACVLHKCVFILLPVVENTKRHDISSKFLPGCVLPKTIQAMYEYCGGFWNQLKSLCHYFL